MTCFGDALQVQDDQIGAGFSLCEADFNGVDAKDNMVRWMHPAAHG